MVHMDIFILGLFVTSITVAGIILVGLNEAEDPVHSQPEDLTTWEKRLVDRPDVKEQEEVGVK